MGVAGDVLLHCVVDAILGALGLPDIGQIFPDSDPKWKGAASSVFIKEAVRFSTNFHDFDLLILFSLLFDSICGSNYYDLLCNVFGFWIW